MEHLDILDSRTGKSYKIPIDDGYIRAADIGRISIPECGVANDIKNEFKNTRGLRILDTGYQNTACVESSITFVDGHRGVIRYRDFDIQQLFHNYEYEDIMHLIIWGHLPSQAEKDNVRAEMSQAMSPPDSVVRVISAFPRNAETMPMTLAGMSAFAAADETVCATRHTQRAMFQGRLDVADAALVRTVGYIAATTALIYCHKNDKSFTPPEPNRSLVGNLLWMMGIAQENPKVEECLNKLWILYADHEITNSTAAVLHAGSTLIDPVSAVMSGIICGYGPLHGGAIDLAYEALAAIGTPERVPYFIEGVKKGKGRLFGYGHRIYKTRDPRLSLIEELMEKYKEELDANPLIRVSLAIDKYASQDPYFIERNLKANADLMGCFLYTAMGFDPEIIVAITALSRCAGALAHWRESLRSYNSNLKPMALDDRDSLAQATRRLSFKRSKIGDGTIAVNNDSLSPNKNSSQLDPVVILPKHTIYNSREKRLIVISAAFSALFSSWTAQIYLPALNNAADDLDTSAEKINLTVTGYMIFQGLTPIFISGYADAMGRRPVYIICFILYIATDIALALTNSYGSLLGLRSVQAITISSTQALCQGVVADISTSAERGQYAAFLALPTVLGPSVGPVIGGAIAQYLGWRNIFWFLAITGGINLSILLILFPETCRRIVGDGSILPGKVNQTLLQLLQNRRKDQSHQAVTNTILGLDTENPKAGFGWARFLSALTLLFEKELFLISAYGGLLFAGLYAVGTAAPSLFAKYYGYSGLTIGLLYLPLAAGSIIAVVLVGKAMNWNFQRHAKRLGVIVNKDQQMDLSEFPIERARIEVLAPPFLLSVLVIAAWGWAVEEQISIGVVVVLIFLLGLGLSGAASVFSALITDIRPGKASAASASNNILKFSLGAAASAAIQPLISAVEPGKAFSIIASFYVVASPCLVLVAWKGMKWRQEKVTMLTGLTDWNSVANKDKLMEVYTKFDESLLALLSKADADTLKVWELLDLDSLSTWVCDRLALLGDAAHPFLPHQGQGAACAIEDAAALGVVLSNGVTPDEVPERLHLYETIRQQRANRLQGYSRIAGQDLGGKQLDMMEFAAYSFGHDEWDNATNIFRRWDWTRKPHLYWRMPVSFGPMPGPRQSFEGQPRKADSSTFITTSIKFKTSRTLLQNLFPSKLFHFKSPGTVAYASFSQTTLNKMEWLSGSGYRHMGLYIHGVQYAQKSGEILDGTFLPVLFENLADPIVSGREELGMPKLYCSLDIWRSEKSMRIQANWRGAVFGNIVLEGLQDVSPSEDKGTIGGEDDQGILAYKYVPQVGNRGKPDVEYATFVSHAEEARVVPSKILRVLKAKHASVSFDPLDWEALPTLHHVSSRLAEIPIYEVISAKIVEGLGVPDVSSARRID
ncbi:hypothetical protein NUW58_g1855 [Xylaria curta]|uniref:Uncharacterized protein n=1 Tax=Xylaria curta TaxID=42375 RepID=A0ACC1PJZ6_9PEZI|nr:hypothetical protein NUW58_g1855 [Xylaria curta]